MCLLHKVYQLHISISTRGNVVQKYDLFWYFYLALQHAPHMAVIVVVLAATVILLIWAGTRMRTGIWLTVALFGYSLQSHSPSHISGFP